MSSNFPLVPRRLAQLIRKEEKSVALLGMQFCNLPGNDCLYPQKI